MRCRVCAIATSIFFSIDGTDWSTWNRWAEGMLDGRIIEWWKCQLCLISILFFTLSQNIELGIFTKERDLNKNQWMPIVWVWQPCFCPGPFPCNPDSKCCGYSFSHSSSHPLNPSKTKPPLGQERSQSQQQEWENRCVEHKQNTPRSASRKRLLEVLPTIQRKNSKSRKSN